MSRSASLILSVAAGCLSTFASFVAHSETPASIPQYFFKEWKVTKSCLEEHAGPQGHVKAGQKFRMTGAAPTSDGQAFKLKALDEKDNLLGGDWSNVKLEFREGAKMSGVPADFECVPGEASASPFLALGNYTTSAEPWYAYKHWYGVVNIHGVPHHLMIFPRDVTGTNSAIIIIQDSGAGDGLTLDHNGVVHTQN
jgi:hypothetical protein